MTSHSLRQLPHNRFPGAMFLLRSNPEIPWPSTFSSLSSFFLRLARSQATAALSTIPHLVDSRFFATCHSDWLVDTVDEADILMIRVGLRIRRFPATPYKDDDFMKSWFAPAIKSLLQSLEKRGLKDDDLAPEIVGRNEWLFGFSCGV